MFISNDVAAHITSAKKRPPTYEDNLFEKALSMVSQSGGGYYLCEQTAMEFDTIFSIRSHFSEEERAKHPKHIFLSRTVHTPGTCSRHKGIDSWVLYTAPKNGLIGSVMSEIARSCTKKTPTLVIFMPQEQNADEVGAACKKAMEDIERIDCYEYSDEERDFILYSIAVDCIESQFIGIENPQNLISTLSDGKVDVNEIFNKFGSLVFNRPIVDQKTISILRSYYFVQQFPVHGDNQSDFIHANNPELGEIINKCADIKTIYDCVVNALSRKAYADEILEMACAYTRKYLDGVPLGILKQSLGSK